MALLIIDRKVRLGVLRVDLLRTIRSQYGSLGCNLRLAFEFFNIRSRLRTQNSHAGIQENLGNHTSLEQHQNFNPHMRILRFLTSHQTLNKAHQCLNWEFLDGICVSLGLRTLYNHVPLAKL